VDKCRYLAYGLMAITVKNGKKKDNKHANFLRKLVIAQGHNFKRGDSAKF
jgi:hypothetical protein